MTRPPSRRPEPSADAQAGDWVAVGEIVGAFGIRGEMKVRLLTDFPERFATTRTLYLGEEHTPRTVLGARVHKEQILLRLEGTTDPETAARMRGTVIWIPEAEISTLSPDQYYLHDVVGLRVVAVDGRELGRVSGVITSGGQDLFVVRNERTGRESLLPAVKTFIKSVDLDSGVIMVETIPGLFDDGADEVR